MRAVALSIGASHPAFEGHFPGTPVLPGVVLLDEAIRAIELWDGGGTRRWRISAVKFLRAVAPGEALTLEQERLQSGTFRFTIVSADQGVVAAGTLSPA